MGKRTKDWKLLMTEKKSIDEIRNDMHEIVYSEKLSTGMACVFGNQDFSKSIYIGENGSGIPLNEHVLFDLASVTKLFLAIVILKLEEEKLIDINRNIGDYTKDYAELTHVKIRELMSFRADLRTDKRIEKCTSVEEAMDSLYGIHYSKSNIQIYSDMGSMILGFLLRNVTGKDFGEWITEIFVKPLGLNEFYHSTKIDSSKMVCMDYSNELKVIDDEIIPVVNEYGKVHDPKARLFNSVCGHAGVFSSATDIEKVMQAVVNHGIISDRSCRRLIVGDGLDIHARNQSFGYLCYRYCNNPLVSKVPEVLKDDAIAANGYTGAYILLDFKNKNYLFIGGNRLKDRVSSITGDKYKDEHVLTFCGKEYINSSNYAYRRGSIRNKCVDYLMKRI